MQLSILYTTTDTTKKLFKVKNPEETAKMNVVNSPASNYCNVCGNESKFRCSSCQMAYYCSKVHQVEDWKKNHKEICVIHQKLKELDMAQMKMQNASSDSSDSFKQFDLTQATAFQEIQGPCSFLPIDRLSLVSLQDLCERILSDLDNRNFSVIDNFLEEVLLFQVLEEVRKLYIETSTFQPGQLSNINRRSGLPIQANKEVRGDLVTWVDSAMSQRMKSLMSAVRRTDELIAFMSSDRKLAGCNIRSRSSIMVACYPGQGTRYKRHVDNPSGDGRKLTTILYLNENYDASRDGGMLRIFKPDSSIFYEVAPIFGRLIVFWSDSRTPHEVLPSYRERFAISVWYFDTKERNEALLCSSSS